MIGLDTNVVIRYITQDDPAQAKKATVLIEKGLSQKQPGFITLISLVEITWVLESCYGQSRTNILSVIQALLTTKQLVVENADIAYIALKRCRATQGDFSDALIAAVAEKAGCSKVMTFDRKAKAIGMTLV